jgi:uncharacterized membrane protein YgcG
LVELWLFNHLVQRGTGLWFQEGESRCPEHVLLPPIPRPWFFLPPSSNPTIKVARDAMESLLLCFLTCNHMQASNGQAMGKRLVVCTGMAWYWQPGFWNIVMCLVIFGVGSFLSAFAEVVKEETEQQSGDGQPHASTSSSSSPGGSSGPSGQSGGGGKKGRGKHR